MFSALQSCLSGTNYLILTDVSTPSSASSSGKKKWTNNHSFLLKKTLNPVPKSRMKLKSLFHYSKTAKPKLSPISNYCKTSITSSGYFIYNYSRVTSRIFWRSISRYCIVIFQYFWKLKNLRKIPLLLFQTFALPPHV